MGIPTFNSSGFSPISSTDVHCWMILLTTVVILPPGSVGVWTAASQIRMVTPSLAPTQDTEHPKQENQIYSSRCSAHFKMHSNDPP